MNNRDISYRQQTPLDFSIDKNSKADQQPDLPFRIRVIQLFGEGWRRKNAGCGFDYEGAVTAETLSSQGI